MKRLRDPAESVEPQQWRPDFLTPIELEHMFCSAHALTNDVELPELRALVLHLLLALYMRRYDPRRLLRPECVEALLCDHGFTPSFMPSARAADGVLTLYVDPLYRDSNVYNGLHACNGLLISMIGTSHLFGLDTVWPAFTDTASETICAHIEAARPYVNRVCILIDVPLPHECIIFGSVMERLGRDGDGNSDLHDVTLVQSPIQDRHSRLLALQRLLDAVTRRRLCLAPSLFRRNNDGSTALLSLLGQQLRDVPHKVMWSQEAQARERFTAPIGVGQVVRALAHTLATAAAAVYKE